MEGQEPVIDQAYAERASWLWDQLRVVIWQVVGQMARRPPKPNKTLESNLFTSTQMLTIVAAHQTNLDSATNDKMETLLQVNPELRKYVQQVLVHKTGQGCSIRWDVDLKALQTYTKDLMTA